VIRLSGIATPEGDAYPVISSVCIVDSRQWESAVPGPPVFSTGTLEPVRPKIELYSRTALAPT
jgi:hypothetical protein